jgi:hypothetical protein
MGSLYWSQHELAFVFKKGWECHRNNVGLGQYGPTAAIFGAIRACAPLLRTATRAVCLPFIIR